MAGSIERVITPIFLLFVFLLPWQTRWILKRGEIGGAPFEYGTLAFYATDILFWIVFCLFVVWCIARQKKSEVMAHSWRWLLIVTPLLYALASSLWATDSILALFTWISLFESVLLFIFLTQFPLQLSRVIHILLLTASIQATLAFFQVATQMTMESTLLGMALHDVLQGGSAVIETSTIRILRAYGSFPHPNVLGGFLAATLFLCVVYTSRKKILPARHVFVAAQSKIRGGITPLNEGGSGGHPVCSHLLMTPSIPLLEGEGNPLVSPIPSKHWHVFLVIVTILLTLGLFLSFSRSAWLAFGLGLLFFVALLLRHRKQYIPTQEKLLPTSPHDSTSPHFLKIIIAIIAVTSIVIGFFGRDFITTRLTANGRLEQMSLRERARTYQEAWTLLKTHPLKGVGLGNYTLALAQAFPHRAVFEYQPAHNVFLLILVELGSIGFSLIILAFLFLFIHLRRALRSISSRNTSSLTHEKNHWLHAFLAVLVILTVLLSFDHYLWSLHFGRLFFSLILGIFTSCAVKNFSPPTRLVA